MTSDVLPADRRRLTAGRPREAAADFAAQGFVIVRGLLDADELAALRRQADAALRGPLMPGMSRPGNDLLPLRWTDGAVGLFLSDARRITRIRTALGAPDLRWISAYISSKAAGSPALYWHQDWWCWSHPISFQPAAPQVAVICPLEDSTPSHGALRLLPGSHRTCSPLHACLPEPHALAANVLPESHPALADAAGQVTPRLRAGDAVILDYRLLHGAHSNCRRTRRDALLFSFVPDWSGLPRELRAHIIAHPALPGAQEPAARAAPYGPLLPDFDGPAADLVVNRRPPPGLTAVRHAGRV